MIHFRADIPSPTSQPPPHGASGVDFGTVGSRAQKPSRHHPAIQVCFRPTRSLEIQVSYDKNYPTFHYTGWFIGILILAYKNRHILGSIIPLYNLNNQGFFHCPGMSKERGLPPTILWPKDGIGTRKILFDREGSGFLRIVCLPYIYHKDKPNVSK